MDHTTLIFLLGVFPFSVIISMLDRSAEYKNMIIILTSLICFSWGRPFAVCLIFLSVLIDWGLGFAVMKLKERTGRSRYAMPALILSGVMNAGLFLVFAHNELMSGRLERFSVDKAIIPLGIGYYAVRGFSYVYDVYKGRIKAEKNVFCLFTYMMAFMFMCAGPAVRYGDMESQIRSREVTTEKLNMGLNSVFWGIGKAVLLSAPFHRIELVALNGSEITTAGCWLGMLSYFARNYFLFTGLCDIANGLCLVYGFVLPRNYRDIEPKELFTGLVRSYNTSIVTFFGEVFGANDRSRPVFAAIGAVLSGAVIGFWYDSQLSFLIVGAAAGLLVALEMLVLRKLLEDKPAVVQYIYMVLAALLIFSATYFSSTRGLENWFYSYKKWLLGLVGVGTKYTLSVAVRDMVMRNLTLIIIAFAVICAPVKRRIRKAVDDLGARSIGWYSTVRITKTVCTAAVFVISIITLVAEQAG